MRYKSNEALGEDKTIAEANSDRSGVEAELDATAEYLAKLVDLSEDIEQQHKRERPCDWQDTRDCSPIRRAACLVTRDPTKSMVDPA